MREATDDPALRILVDAVARLQSGSQLDSEDLWLGRTADELSRGACGADVQESAISVLEAIQQLRRVNELLDILSRSSKSLLSALRDKSRSVSHQSGIMALPNEVLAQIFGFVKDSYRHVGRDNEAESATKPLYTGREYNVCQRFRRIALTTPTLWSTLSSDMNLGMFRVHLARSKNAALSVVLCSFRQNTKLFSAFLQELAPHNYRWEELVIEFPSHLMPNLAPFSARLREIPQLKELELPALKSLVMRASGALCRSFSTAEVYEEDPLSSWWMPALRRLDFSAVIPCLTHQFGETIRSLTFSFGGLEVGLRPFFDFLATVPNLEDFTLIGALPCTYHTDRSEELCASLPSLISLSLRSCDNRTLKFVLTAFDAPKVTRLFLDMDLTDATTSRLTFLNVLHEHTPFISRIRTLELSLDHSRSHLRPHSELDHIFANFSSLEHFTLISSPTRPYMPTREKLEGLMFHNTRSMPLRTIRITDCSDLTASLPRMLYYLTKTRRSETGTEPEGSKFEKLVIAGRTNFVEEDFALIPKEKVIWVPEC